MADPIRWWFFHPLSEPGLRLPPEDSSFECAFASTRIRPSLPSILQVAATSHCGVRDVDPITSSHHSASSRRTVAATKPSSRSIRASADGFASHPLFVLIGLPMGSHRSFADTVTSGRPTRSVNRAATSWLLPSVSRTHRGRLPRLSLPSACHHAVPIRSPLPPSTGAATDLATFRPPGCDACRSGSSSHSSVRRGAVNLTKAGRS